MTTYTAFAGHHRIATGTLATVAARCKALLDADLQTHPLVFDDSNGRPFDIDYSGAPQDVLARLPTEPAAARRGPGRPKLGVVAREVTLLPRHWEWLATQPGGASVALRRLVEQASRDNAGADRLRETSEAVDRLMLALAGDLPGYEEVSRAFHRREAAHFGELTEAWPDDVRDYIRQLAAPVFT